MNIEFRAATNINQDLSFIAWGYNEATNGLFESMLGSKWQARLMKVIGHKGHDLSYEHITIAEKDGKTAGMLSGMTSDKIGKSLWYLMKYSGLNCFRIMFIIIIAWPIFSAMDHHMKGEWYLQAIAVSDKMRSQGIGSMLINKAKEYTKLNHCQKLVLDVASDNTGGMKLYKRLGFELTSTSKPSKWMNDLRIHRMELPLE